jgi:hypothetical protein
LLTLARSKLTVMPKLGMTYGEVFAALDTLSRALGRTVNPTVYSSAEFSQRTKTDNAFIARVLEGPKVWVIGAGDGLVVGA